MPAPLCLPALDPAEVPKVTTSTYPPAFQPIVAGRERQRLGDAAGLTHFGVNLVTLPPGCQSSVRHWHDRQDEFIYVLEGELVLATEAGEQRLQAGHTAGFPAGVADGHCLINRSIAPARFLEIGDRTPGDTPVYPDADLIVRRLEGQPQPFHKDGTPY